MNQLNANEIAVLAMCYAGHPMPTDAKGETYKWVQNALYELARLDMLDPNLKVTGRGDVFMDHITDLNLPQKTWSME